VLYQLLLGLTIAIATAAQLTRASSAAVWPALCQRMTHIQARHLPNLYSCQMTAAVTDSNSVVTAYKLASSI
jgi:hypothetical protein